MKFIPYDRFTIDTTLSQNEVVERLKTSLGERILSGFAPIPRNELFHGDIWETGFLMRRIHRYRNDFEPVIDGRIQSTNNGTRINITLRPMVFCCVFMTIWLGAVGSVLIFALAKGSQEFGSFNPLKVTVFMFCAGIIMLLGGFWFEAVKIKPLLEYLLIETETAED